MPRARTRRGGATGARTSVRLKARHDARSGHGPVAAGALRWGEPVLDSAHHRDGRRAPALPRPDVGGAGGRRACASRRVAELLWTGRLPAAAPAWQRAGAGAARGARWRRWWPARLAARGAALVVPALGARRRGALRHHRPRRELARARALPHADGGGAGAAGLARARRPGARGPRPRARGAGGAGRAPHAGRRARGGPRAGALRGPRAQRLDLRRARGGLDRRGPLCLRGGGAGDAVRPAPRRPAAIGWRRCCRRQGGPSAPRRRCRRARSAARPSSPSATRSTPPETRAPGPCWRPRSRSPRARPACAPCARWWRR